VGQWCSNEGKIRSRSPTAAADNPSKSFDPKIFLSKVGSGRTITPYQDSQAVFSQGDKADSVYYVQKGKLRLTVVSKQGKEATIAILTAGNFFGEGCLAGQTKRMATVTAMTACVIARLEKPAIIRVLREEPVFSELFVQHLLSRNIRIEEDLIDQLFNSSEKRLARVLLLLANFGKETTPELMVGKISQQMLAGIVGTTRARVNFFLNRFPRLGFIDYDKDGLHIHRSLLPVVLSD
jgi:CRP/FNR family transcriptional regulator, cyclic AMP receptor protein